MMACYTAWHSNYVTHIWDPRHECPAGLILNQPDLFHPALLNYDAPFLVSARYHIEETWLRADEAVNAELERGYHSSIHYCWVEDVRDFLDGPRVLDHYSVARQADNLASEMRRHDGIYDSEKKACREIVNALRSWAHALHELVEVENDVYIETMRKERSGS